MSFNMKNLGSMMKKMQDDMAVIQKELGEVRIVGADPSNKVTATVNGHKELFEIKIDPSCIDPDDVTLLEDLVLFAVQNAMKKAEEMSQTKLGALTQGMPNIPGMKMPF